MKNELLLAELKQMHEDQLDMRKEQSAIASDVRLMKDRQYGDGTNGFEGDIPEIKRLFGVLEKRVSRNSRYIYVVLGLLSASGVGAGLASWL